MWELSRCKKTIWKNSLKQRDALKLVNQAAVENGKAYATSSKVAGKYIAGLAQGFQ